MPGEQYIPRSSRDAFDSQKGAAIQNPGLWFDKFLGVNIRRDDPSAKRSELEQVIDAATRADCDLLDAWRARWEAIALEAHCPNIKTLRSDWRLVTGTGRKGPLEVGFAFHRYGFPYLPASGLKGLARSYAILEFARLLCEYRPELAEPVREAVALVEQPNREELNRAWKAGYADAPEALQKKLNQIRLVFGYRDHAGGAVFFDGIPAHRPELQLDIVTPHAGSYYLGDEGPVLWRSPKPSPFLTVAPQTEFCFAVGWRGAWDDEARAARDQAEAWLLGGLAELGTGAKTSAGYGYFQRQTGDTIHKSSSGTAQTESDQSSKKPPIVLPIVMRHGVVTQSRPDLGWVEVQDDQEAGKRIRIPVKLFGGKTPGKKVKVSYQLQGDDVISVKIV